MPQHCNDFTRSHAIAGDGLPSIEPGMPTPAGTGLTRRSLMLRGSGLGLAVYGGSLMGAPDQVEAAINDALSEHKVLISVFVDGGWDSMSVLAPFGTDHRHETLATALRPKLFGAVSRTGATTFAADPSLSWNPAAAGLRDLWDDPSLGMAVAPAVGYAGPNYSHFTSRHFWEVGGLEYGETTGWMGRYLDRVGRPDVPIQGVSLGISLSPLMATSKVPVAAVYDIDSRPNGYPNGWGQLVDLTNTELATLNATSTGDVQRDQARLAAGAAAQLKTSLAAGAAVAQPSVAYPSESSDFVDQLKDAARLLGTRVDGAALPIRCMSLRAHGNFDTHNDQIGTFATNLSLNARALKAFWADLKARGQDDRVVMLVWSEFGRRPQDNGSNGCDHGAAGMAMVIGKSVKQGLIGEFPGLKAYGSTDSGLMQDGNLRATSDFRGIYSALLEQWLGTDAEGIIPGAGARPGAGAFARPTLL